MNFFSAVLNFNLKYGNNKDNFCMLRMRSVFPSCTLIKLTKEI